jgi:ubiquinol-cytochrome c reductase cytochrome b subunit
MTEAYRSALHISFDVKAGLLIRQTHHWAANVFLVAIVLHLLRVFFTGAYRKPRELTYLLGVTMLALALVEGYLGYSLVDDLLSGMGLAIGYSVLASVPLVGANLALLAWGGPFPGGADFWPRMYVTHVLILPAAIATLLALHLLLVASRHHTQFGGPRRTQRRLVGMPMFPAYAPRSLGLLLAVAAVLVLLGGLAQINPIWLWGPYHVALATNGAQPDWYLGWLIGTLRLVPGFDVVIGGRTVVPNPFWGGALFPAVVFGFLYLWPWLERRFTGDRGWANVLERPRDRAFRTGVGVALVTWLFVVFLAGSADRVSVSFGVSYTAQIWVYRVLFLAAPLVALLVTRRVCRELVAGEQVAVRRRAAERAASEPTAPGSRML